MEAPEFWQVHIGQGLGPLTLGATRRELSESWQPFEFKEKLDPCDEKAIIQLQKLGIVLTFSADVSQQLQMIEVTNPLVRFAAWEVIGKPVHKVVRFFKCTEQETLWCDRFDEKSQRELERRSHGNTHLERANNVQLLRRGTLWIPALGLGFALREGKVQRLYQCLPERSPKYGSGRWNVVQKTMSETGRIPRNNRTALGESRAVIWIRSWLTLLLITAIGIIAWNATQLQLRWNARPDIPAQVISVTPPPPAPFVNQLEIQYEDEQKRSYQVTLERMDFFDEPQLHSTVLIRFLLESPQAPLGDRRWVDVGLNEGLPKAGFAVAIYAVVMGCLELLRWTRIQLS